MLKQVSVSPWDRLARNVRDQFDGLETGDYDNDTNISDLGTKKGIWETNSCEKNC